MVVVSPGQWDSMEEYTCMIPRDTHDGAFYRAVLALHQDLFSLAQQVCEIITQHCKAMDRMYMESLYSWKLAHINMLFVN